MVAKILKVEAEQVILELKTNGEHVTIAMDKLSAGDAVYVLQHSGAEGTLPLTRPPVWPPPRLPVRPPSPAGTEPLTIPAAPAAAASASAAGQIYPRTRKEIEAGIKEITKRPRPPELSADVHEATKQLNIYRFLCGLSCDVKGDVECSKNATDAAMACRQAGTVSHDLGHSTDRCNLSTMGNAVASVAQFMEDGGGNNRDGRGHRAWCLNPPMGKVGFGSASKSFSAMWCMDESGTSAQGTWAYPGKGLFPVQYVHGSAWSFYGVDSATIPKVEVFRLSKRPEEPLPPTGDIAGHEIKVLHVSRAMMNGFNFEPADPAKRGIYWVRITSESLHEGYLVELY